MKSTLTERLLGSHMSTLSVVGFILFHVNWGRTFVLIKLRPDPMSRFVANLLVGSLVN